MTTKPQPPPEPVAGLPRRAFTRSLCLLGLGAAWPGAFAARPEAATVEGVPRPDAGEALRLFLCGDAMTGRGDAHWLAQTLTRHSRRPDEGVRVEVAPCSGRDYPALTVSWGGG